MNLENFKIMKPLILAQLKKRLNGQFKTQPDEINLRYLSGDKLTELTNCDTGETLKVENDFFDGLTKNLSRFFDGEINAINANIKKDNIFIEIYHTTSTGEKLKRSFLF